METLREKLEQRRATIKNLDILRNMTSAAAQEYHDENDVFTFNTFAYLIMSQFGIQTWLSIVDEQQSPEARQELLGSLDGGDFSHPLEALRNVLFNSGRDDAQILHEYFEVIDRYYCRRFDLLRTIRDYHSYESYHEYLIERGLKNLLIEIAKRFGAEDYFDE